MANFGYTDSQRIVSPGGNKLISMLRKLARTNSTYNYQSSNNSKPMTQLLTQATAVTDSDNGVTTISFSGEIYAPQDDVPDYVVVLDTNDEYQFSEAEDVEEVTGASDNE